MYPLGFVESLSVGYIYLKFLINRSRSRLLLGSYFSCVDIFSNKMHFTCIWVVLSFEIQTELASRTAVTGNQFFKLPKKRELHILTKKKKIMQIHKILPFPSKNFLILKLLYDSLIINAARYVSFKILVKTTFFLGPFFFFFKTKYIIKGTKVWLQT